ncbi:MAG: hypothetical protein FWC57_00715 [Endomicrobia bacterium]|nr:hypothetical protein [Endomicrobiia bacterium]
MNLLIDIFLVASIAAIAYLGWKAGLTRSFFAVLAGFLAMFAAHKYPYHDGINIYLVFVITALFVMMAGGFTLRIVHFFYMNIVDKAGGAALSVLVWLVVSVNIVVPTLTHGTHALDGSTHTLYKTISDTMQRNIPLFRDYVPASLETKALERQRKTEV